MMINMQRTCATEISAVLSKCGFSSQSLSESASIFLILTTCFFWGIMAANCDLNVFIISRENSYKIGRALYGVWLIFLQRRRVTVRHCTVLGRAPADVFIYRRQTAPVRYVTTQEKILQNRPAIIKFAGDVHIAEIVRWQFYLWP